MILNFIFITLSLLVYDVVGYVFIKKILGKDSYFAIPFGYLIITSIFQLFTMPIMAYKLSFSYVMYFVVPVVLLFIIYCFYKALFKMEYFKYFIKRIKDPYFYLVFMITILYGLFIILFAADADQYLYQKMVQITLETNVVFDKIIDAHQLNGIYLFNSVLIKLYSTDVLTYTYGAFRFIEAFHYVFLFAAFNDIVFKNKKTTMLMMGLGLFGFIMFSPGIVNPGYRLTSLFGNSGTYHLTYTLPILYALNLYVKNPNNKYILFLIFISPFTFTTSLYPFALYFMLIYYYLFKKDELNFLYVFLIYIYCVGFYIMLMGIPIVLIVFPMLVVLMRIAWIKKNNSKLDSLYKYMLIFHTLFFLILSGIDIYMIKQKLLILIFILIYYKKRGLDNTLKYSLFLVWIYFLTYNNYSETSILIIGRRLILFIPLKLYYDVFLMNKKFIYLTLTSFLILITYSFNNESMLYSPKAQYKNNQLLKWEFYNIENLYEFDFKPDDKLYQQVFNPRVYSLGTFQFSLNPNQCSTNDDACRCAPEDNCYIINNKYQQTSSYDYYYDNYSNIVSLEEYFIISKTNDNVEIQKWIDSQLRNSNYKETDE